MNQLPISASDLDFSDEYNTEVLDFGFFNGYPFIITVTELSNAEYVRLQKEFLGTLHIPENKQDMKRQLREKKIDPTERNDKQALAAVKSWTLKTKDGRDIPVGYDAWRALPRRITEATEAAIARLNPTIDEDFQD